jgi:hypothetical protein
MSPLHFGFLVPPALGAAFTAVLWYPYRARKWLAIVIAWAVFVAAHAYVAHQLFCATTLTCGPRGIPDKSAPMWGAATAALGYAATVLFVAFIQRVSSQERPTVQVLLLGALITTGALQLASEILWLVWYAAA